MKPTWGIFCWKPGIRQRRGEEFDELSKVVQRIPVRRIIPHQDAARIGELCELILADVARVLNVSV
jgi:hypothetical protein